MIAAVESRSFAYEWAFLKIIRLSSAGLDGPELLRRSAESLRRAVPFGSYCVATVDPASNLLTHIFNGGSAGEDGHAEAYGEVLHRMYFEEDLTRLVKMLRERRPAQPLSEAAGGARPQPEVQGIPRARGLRPRTGRPFRRRGIMGRRVPDERERRARLRARGGLTS
jgi:hypothetical protein